MKRLYERSLLQKPSLRSLSLQSVCDDKEMQSTRDSAQDHPSEMPRDKRWHILLLREPEQTVVSLFSEPQMIKSL